MGDGRTPGGTLVGEVMSTQDPPVAGVRHGHGPFEVPARTSPERRPRRRLIVVAALGIVAVVAATSGCGPGPDDTVRLDAPGAAASPTIGGDTPDLAGQAAPSVSWERFDGGTGSLEDLRGRPVVINFWSSTCPPCISEMPAFEQVHQELGDEVSFVGLDVADAEAAGRAMAEQTGVTYELGFDRTGELIRAMGGVGLPTTVVIDGDGTIVDTHTGALSADQLHETLAGLIGPTS